MNMPFAASQVQGDQMITPNYNRSSHGAVEQPVEGGEDCNPESSLALIQRTKTASLSRVHRLGASSADLALYIDSEILVSYPYIITKWRPHSERSPWNSSASLPALKSAQSSAQARLKHMNPEGRRSFS